MKKKKYWYGKHNHRGGLYVISWHGYAAFVLYSLLLALFYFPTGGNISNPLPFIIITGIFAMICYIKMEK